MFTFKDLKEELDKLTPEQLGVQVYLSREDETLKVAGLSVVEADLYRHKDNPEDIGTLGQLVEIHGEHYVAEDYIPSTTKGTPFLNEDF